MNPKYIPGSGGQRAYHALSGSSAKSKIDEKMEMLASKYKIPEPTERRSSHRSDSRRERSRSGRSKRRRPSSSSSSGEEQHYLDPERCLFLHNLDAKISSFFLSQNFAMFGKVDRTLIISKGQRGTCALIQFESQRDRAFEGAQGKVILGKCIKMIKGEASFQTLLDHGLNPDSYFSSKHS
jgi:hypothetical protein